MKRTAEDEAGNPLRKNFFSVAESDIGQLFTKDLAAKFSNSIPFYCPYSSEENVLIQVQDFIKTEPKEASILTIFDSPGVGKTTTIQVAAKLSNAFYVRLTPAHSILTQYKSEFDACRVPEKGVKEQYFMKSMENLALSTFAAIWKAISKTKEFNGGTLLANGFEKLDDAASEEEEVRNELIQRTSRIVVLHLDEIQTLSTVKYDWERCHQRPVVQSDVPNYALICLTAVWAKIFGPKVRLVLTGTNTKLGVKIRVGLEVKVQPATIGTFTAQMVHDTIQHFFRIDESKVNCDQMFKSLEGPPRITEYFLVHLKNRAYDELISQDSTAIADILWKSYKAAKADYFNYLSDIQAVNRVVYHVYYADLLGGKSTSEGTVFPVEKIDPALYKDAETGLARLQLEGNMVFIRPLHPLLIEYLGQCLLPNVHNEVAVEKLVYQLKASQAQNPDQQFGQAFQHAVAVELTNPSSLLWQKLCEAWKDPITPYVVSNTINYFTKPTEKRKEAGYIELSNVGDSTDIIAWVQNGQQHCKCSIQVKRNKDSSETRQEAAIYFQKINASQEFQYAAFLTAFDVEPLINRSRAPNSNQHQTDWFTQLEKAIKEGPKKAMLGKKHLEETCLHLIDIANPDRTELQPILDHLIQSKAKEVSNSALKEAVQKIRMRIYQEPDTLLGSIYCLPMRPLAELRELIAELYNPPVNYEFLDDDGLPVSALQEKKPDHSPARHGMTEGKLTIRVVPGQIAPNVSN